MRCSKKSLFIFATVLFSLSSVEILFAQQTNSTPNSTSARLVNGLPAMDSNPVIPDNHEYKASEPNIFQTSKIHIQNNSYATIVQPLAELNTNPFSIQLYEFLLAKTSSHKAQDQLIKDFYEARAYQPLWTDQTGYNQSAKAVKMTLDNAASHGLKTASYKIPDFISNQLEAEISLTNAAIRYAGDAAGARLNPRNISRLITAEPVLANIKDILQALGTSKEAGKTLEEYNPQHIGYKALKTKLAEQVDPVKQADIIANMERWRWLPHDLGNSYILVNIPEYQLYMVRNGAEIHQTRVIVGKPQTPTPVFTGAMDHLIVNPYWNIPPSIILKEMLPKLQSDPYALHAKGFEIIKRGRVVDPSTVNWSGSIENISIRQPPGERNALGLIKFMFPNDHAVYLHDTPSRGLFANSERAFSHGCIRVLEPFKLAELVLSADHNVSEGRLRSMIGGSERYFNMQTKLPVHIVYFTNFVDSYGQLQSSPDIYGFNRRVKLALGL